MTGLVPGSGSNGDGVNGRALTQAAPAAWTYAPQRPPAAPSAGSLRRHFAAMRRHKWWMLAVIAVGTVGGVIATRFIKPEYEVRASIWIESETPISDRSGPIRSRELLNSAAWVELLKSYRISDAVVRRLSLYIKPESEEDRPVFDGFALADRFRPGDYLLTIDPARRRYSLTSDGIPIDSAAVGDSIGGNIGFRWAPRPEVLAGTEKTEINFTVATPRETAIQLREELVTDLPDRSNFLWLTLTGTDPERTAQTLNAWLDEYVSVAAELKKKNIVEFAKILGEQVRYAEANLRAAEGAFHTFRVQTITLPSENTPVVAGLQLTQDPAFKSFFDQKIEFDNLRRDREALESILARRTGGSISTEALMFVPSVSAGQQGLPLRDGISQLYAKMADRRAKGQVFTDSNKVIRELDAEITELQTRTIPQLALALATQMREREVELDRRIQGASQELRAIPTRSIEEMRLSREVQSAAALYTTLQTRYAEAQLAEASAIPDVRIHDPAIAPLEPTTNTAPGVILMAILGSIGVAVALAIALDRTDRRVRYVEHASQDLGLSIVGAVPTIRSRDGHQSSPEEISQVLEAFRSMRLNLIHGAGGTSRLAVAITSPGAGDGKSLISSNLALSFAEAGFRTVLVDGDTRRGALHETFGITVRAGLTDYLTGEASYEEIIHSTSHDLLVLVPRGGRKRRSPELLESPAMSHLLQDLRARHEIVIVDTPPLAAGVDAFAIGTVAGKLLVVLRVDKTDRRLAEAKLSLMDRLPVHVVGAVLNGIDMKGEFEYYAYLEGYGAVDEDAAPQLVGERG